MRKSELKGFLSKMDKFKLSPQARMLFLALEIGGFDGVTVKNTEIFSMTGLYSSAAVKRAAAELEEVNLIARKITRHGVEYTLL
ncbi:hypothetical protein [Bacillus cereus]|uniref:hypothetical protein n=1 Tax=Bacillus cereus TaxID=1396 RepID=UPI00192643DB|nr:hypothetical protein [Bacillus cereus]MBL3774959.1 hypothetical protein [Bacillus cereus]MBL3780776.1 hypothetical protein [Bacillus cereus]MBL3792064.1 hypothetical protein [Bacillus cereus]